MGRFGGISIGGPKGFHTWKWESPERKIARDIEPRLAGLETTARKKKKTTATALPKPTILPHPELETPSSGGQASRKLLLSTLGEARRRARLTGRELSEAEVEGLTTAHFRGAEGRLTERKGLGLAERGQDITLRGQDIGERLAYAGLKTKERGQDIGLEAAKIGAETQRYVTGETSGFFGGGGFLGTGCIIITACTSPDSDEVNVTRRYRDKIMLPETLRGYYMLAEQVVPLIHKSDKLRRFLKKYLVDSLAATCGWKLKERDMPSWKARIITGLFLGGCNLLGHTKPQFVRYNGEMF